MWLFSMLLLLFVIIAKFEHVVFNAVDSLFSLPHRQVTAKKKDSLVLCTFSSAFFSPFF